MKTYPQNLPSLTRMRFFAALWVVFYHWREPWVIDIDATSQIFAMGRFGVDLFFILSGFVLTHVYVAAREEGRFNFGRFIIARFARIYPLHIATLAFLGLVAIGAAQLGVPFEQDRFPLQDLPAHLLMVHAWGFAPNFGWNGPSWSISAEWFAYLAFPAYLMVAVALKNRPLILLTLAVALFFVLDQVHLRFFGETLPMATERYGVIRIIPEFLIGVGLYRLGQKWQLPKPIARASLAVVVALYLFGSHIAVDDRVLALLGAPLIFLLAELDRRAVTKTNHGFFVYLGDVSYAIYMIHVPFFMVSFNLLQDVLGVIDETMSTSLFAALLMIMIGASAVTYQIIEKPARTGIRALGDRLLKTPTKSSIEGKRL
ncbi:MULTISPECIES: acyltransferase [Maricaulis]|uniref:acyltransferase family protein n=1 Tax=Maricaulis TaxID=74317 RepID=UPI0025BD47D0|nr:MULTISPECIES: acyltransferase [Maricaulis]